MFEQAFSHGFPRSPTPYSVSYTYGYGRAEDLAGVAIVLVIAASSWAGIQGVLANCWSSSIGTPMGPSRWPLPSRTSTRRTVSS